MRVHLMLTQMEKRTDLMLTQLEERADPDVHSGGEEN
jgi:hypothetical protein